MKAGRTLISPARAGFADTPNYTPTTGKCKRPPRPRAPKARVRCSRYWAREKPTRHRRTPAIRNPPSPALRAGDRNGFDKCSPQAVMRCPIRSSHDSCEAAAHDGLDGTGIPQSRSSVSACEQSELVSRWPLRSTLAGRCFFSAQNRSYLNNLLRNPFLTFFFSSFASLLQENLLGSKTYGLALRFKVSESILP